MHLNTGAPIPANRPPHQTPLTEAGAFLAPYLPTEAYLYPAWFGCLAWALQEPGMVEAFRADTGMQWTPGRTPLERLIDEATGADTAFLEAFAAWMNREIWGAVPTIPQEPAPRALGSPYPARSISNPCRAGDPTPEDHEPPG